MKVTLESIKEHIDFKRKLNSVELEDIECTENGVVIPIPKEVLDEWKFVGLTNLFFFELEAWKPENCWKDL